MAYKKIVWIYSKCLYEECSALWYGFILKLSSILERDYVPIMFNSEEQYFDTFSLEIHMVSTTYFDPIFMDAFGFLIDDSNDRYFDSMTTDDTIPFSDELDFSSLYTSRNRIYDIEDSKYDASCNNLLPTPHAYNFSLTETVNLYSMDLYTAVLIIFG